MTQQQLRDLFPALSMQVHGGNLVYFDNAATSQRPLSVIDRQRELSSFSNANIHRAVHHLAAEATESYEQTRDAVKSFIGASSREEVIFTSGTTASINLLAYSFGEAFVNQGDELIVTEAEHHSNIVPWQLLCSRKGASLKVLPVDENGRLRTELLDGLISPRTRLFAFAQISNVLGLVNPLHEIVELCHKRGVPVLVDGAQGSVHQRINVEKEEIDFYAFSGHKLYAATGTGVLFGKREYLDKMPPFMGGGEMIESVSFSGTSYAPLPEKFEAGTQNFNSIPTLIPAIELLKEMEDSELVRQEEAVKEYLFSELSSRGRIRLFGVPHRTIDEKISLFSFCVEGAHHEDLALILDKMGIACRSGQMCAEPLMDRFGVTGMLRISLAPYNTMEEAEYFIKCLDRAIKMLV